MVDLNEHEVLNGVERGILIGGRWEDAENGKTFEVVDPATGSVIAEIADASPADGLRALDAAVAAQKSWAATPARTRSEILRRAYEISVERQEEIALLLTLEVGKPFRDALAEVAISNEFLRWFSEEAVRVNGRYGMNPEGTGRMIITQHPVGPCLFITPWNFPFFMAARKVAPAVAAGCTSVIKPPPLAPLSTSLFAQIMMEAGLPAGVLNVVPTDQSGELATGILQDSRLRKLSFTGSTAVGKILLEQAAKNVLRVSMELGGNAPFIVFEDADLDVAVEGALRAKFRNAGQACVAANRYIVHENVAEDFAARITQAVAGMKVGRGTDPEVEIGPLIDERAVAKGERLVADALERGAKLHHGGTKHEGDGTFLEPTILSGIQPGSEILVEEIFGPVVAITTFTDEADAVRLANDTSFGLMSYVFTQDIDRAHRMIDELETGLMGINSGATGNAAAPFGGMKQSGLGYEGGPEGISEYLNTKYSMIPVI